MFAQWRFELRKAEHAIKMGQLEKACRLVTAPDLRSYRQARDLQGQLADALVARAEEHLRQGDAQRAWSDLAQAEQLGVTAKRLGDVRQELVKRGLDEAMSYLKSGQPEPALEAVDRLAKRGVNSADARRLHDAAAAWRDARAAVRTGKFAAAVDQFEIARGLLSDCESLEHAAEEAWAARERIATLEADLHRALSSQDWQAALVAADAILAVSPEHVQARAARRRAWQVVGAPVSQVPGWRHAVHNDGHGVQRVARTVISPPGAAPIEDDPAGRAAGDARDGQRFLLWIDGVGGYLVCTGDRVSIGQPAGWQVDVPVMADLSRLHAWVERDGEGYLLRAARPAMVDGHAVREKAMLADGARIMLGQSFRLHFRQPSPLSATARLDFDSPHRLSLPADAVLLMAETCIIGPKPSSHVPAAGWKHEVVLYRQGDELWCRAADTFEIDGQSCEGRGRLSLSSRVRGEGFSLALEPIGS